MTKMTHLSNKLQSTSAAITQEFAALKSNFTNPSIDEFLKLADALRRDEADRTQEGRKLRIAVIGQTKVGKSSLLNALFFGGKELLPKATTPMTATLTVISHGEKPALEIEYLNEEDWQGIEEIAEDARRVKAQIERAREEAAKSQKKGIDEEGLNAVFGGGNQGNAPTPPLPEMTADLQAALETVEAATPDTKKKLGTTDREEFQSVDELVGKLAEYAGATGKYTPVVRYVRLVAPLPELEDLEIIDTPGLNDPIASRSHRTRQFVRQCDVGLVLSPAAAFLDKTDQDLVTRALPGDGLRRLRIVATKFDSAVLQEAKPGRNIKELLGVVHRSVHEQLDMQLSRLGQSSEAPHQKAAAQLEKAKPALLISSMAHLLATKSLESLTEEERHLRGKLLAIPGMQADLFGELSNLQAIRQVIEEAHNEKEAILAERLEELVPSYQEKAVALLTTAMEGVQGRLEDLEHSSVEGLRKRQKAVEQLLRDAKDDVNSAINKFIAKVKDEVDAVVTDARKMGRDMAQIQAHAETKTKTGTREKSGFVSSVWRFFGTGGYESYEYTVTEKYLQVDEAVDKLEAFAGQVTTAAEETFQSLTSRQELAKAIRKSLVDGSANLGEIDIDPKRILNMVDAAVNQLELPLFEMDATPFVESIASKFSGRVAEDDFSKFRSNFRKTMGSLAEGVAAECSRQCDQFIGCLENIKGTFLTSMGENFKDQTEQIAAELQDRKANMAAYRSLEEQLRRCRSELSS